MRKIIGLVIGSTMITGIAYADCGWVLWKLEERTTSSKWSIDDSFERRLDCETDRREQATAFLNPDFEKLKAGAPTFIHSTLDEYAQDLKSGRVKVRKSGRRLISEQYDDRGKQISSRSEELWCLPAGTDPRPRVKE